MLWDDTKLELKQTNLTFCSVLLLSNIWHAYIYEMVGSPLRWGPYQHLLACGSHWLCYSSCCPH